MDQERKHTTFNTTEMHVTCKYNDLVHRCLALHPLRDTHPGRVLYTEACVRYVWTVLKCGIYIRIENDQLTAFVPFFNVGFQQPWYRFVPGMEKLYDLHKSRPSKHVHPSKIWSNGHVLCTHRQNTWSTSNMQCLQWWLQDVAQTLFRVHQQSLPKHQQDRPFLFEAFVNKRDAPIHVHPAHRSNTLFHPHVCLPPEAHTWAHQCAKDTWQPFTSTRAGTNAPKDMLPVLSFYGGPLWSDTLIPTPEDLRALYANRITKQNTFASNITAANSGTEPVCPWSRRKAVAVFRGSSTGRSRNASNMNPRLRLVTWAHESGHAQMLDAEITSLNKRWQIAWDGYVQQPHSLCRDTLPVRATHQAYMFAHAQQSFKYVVYVDGHSASSRWGSLMQSGAVILRVAPGACTACETWWDALPLCQGMFVKPDSDVLTSSSSATSSSWKPSCVTPTIPSTVHRRGTFVRPEEAAYCWIAADLSNLKSTILWLRTHDALAQRIAMRAQWIARGALCDVKHHTMLFSTCAVFTSQHPDCSSSASAS